MEQKKMKNRLMLALVLVAVVLLVSTIISGKKRNSADNEATSAVLEETWEQRAIGDTGLTMKVPEGLRSVPTKLDENALKVMEKYDALEYVLGSFQLRINHIKAKADMSPADYTEKLTAMLQNSPEFDSYSNSIRETTQSGRPAYFVRGSAMQNGIDMVINSLIIAKGTDLWEITMIFNSSNRDFHSLMEEVLSSVLVY